MDDGTFIPIIEYTLDPHRNAVSSSCQRRLGLPITLLGSSVGVFVVADALFIGAQQVGRYLPDIRSH
ncbi:hypothetical protein Gotur_013275 [Gossypium turneri]